MRDLNELQAKLTLVLAESSKKDEALYKLEKEAGSLVACVQDAKTTISEQEEAIKAMKRSL